mmetsp:Transcript_852/g.1863  ORF Transcript_852/g.1863 Transcript_852/m.1863 type:complete len:592 (-) Transcript_852:40-1815(-)
MSTSPYHTAGKLVDRVLTERKGLKTVAFSGKKNQQCTNKASYAQACETLRHKALLDAILNHDNGRLGKAVQFDDTRSKGLLYVLLFELLFGKYKNIRGGGKVKRNIIKHEKELRRIKDVVCAERAAACEDGDVTPGGLRDAPVFPRYVRINTLKTTAREVVDTLRADLGGDELKIYADRHVPDLLVLSPSISSQLHNHDLVKSGKIVLQDKSSCFSALVLAHGSRSSSTTGLGDYIDACAAPGNKTSHLAALVSKELSGKQTKKEKKRRNTNNNIKSEIFAFDRSSKRVKILRDRLGAMVPDDDAMRVHMNPLHQDFLSADASDGRFASVRSILLDPSCSGSGIVNAPDRQADGGGSDSRIKSLANFQLVALKHAMLSFPKVDRIVYSTCSVHEEENEQVVATALKETTGEMEGEDDNMHWVLTKPACLDHWERRGRVAAGLTAEQAECLIRADGLRGDNTNGFFVSYFERKRCARKEAADESDYNMKYPEGVAVYDGEFNNTSKDVAVKDVMSVDDADAEREVSKKGGNDNTSNGKKKRKAGGLPDAKGVSKKSKKAQKALAWKRRQAELKLKRIAKKKLSLAAAAAESK